MLAVLAMPATPGEGDAVGTGEAEQSRELVVQWGQQG